MTEPANEPTLDAFPEMTGTSAVIDDIDVWAAPDQWPTADLTGLDDDGADQ